MINGDDFIRIVTDYFNFLSIEFGCSFSKKKFVGNFFYDIEYKCDEKIISISYENSEDYLIVIVYILQNGVIPRYNDEKSILYLDKLSKTIFPLLDSKSISSNNDYFSDLKPNTIIERRLLKYAKDLRLCLLNFDKYKI